MRVIAKLVLVLGASALVACSSQSDPASQELLDLKSEKGLFYASFTPDPDPPTTGENALEISLADPNRQPVAQASIEIEPWMPGHGHGTPIVPVVTDLGAGKYHAQKIDFMMPGFWELTVGVRSGDLRDTFVVAYDVK